MAKKRKKYNMKLIVVTGLYRSGTTLVQKILNSNSEINIINHGMLGYFKSLESIFFKEKGYPFNDRPLCLEFFRPNKDYRKIFDIVNFDEKAVTTLIDQIEKEIVRDINLGGPKTRPTSKWIDCLKKTIKPGKAKEVLKNICKSINLYRGSNNPTYCGFKELNLEQFIEPLIFEFNKDIKVIKIIRDPRAILLSRNYGSIVKTKGGGKIHPLLLVAKTWRTSIRYKLLLSNLYPQNFLPIYYEQLVIDPINEIKKICNFLSIEFSTNLLDFSQYKDEENNIWNVNTSFQEKKGFDQSSINKWKDILPQQVIGAFEFMCCHEMMIEKYCPITDEENMFKDFVNYEDEKDKIKEWTFRFNLLLDSEQKKKEILRNYLLYT